MNDVTSVGVPTWGSPPGQGQRSAPQQTTQGELHAQVSGVPKPCTRGVSSAPLVVLGACYPFWGPQRRGGHAETGRVGGKPPGCNPCSLVMPYLPPLPAAQQRPGLAWSRAPEARTAQDQRSREWAWPRRRRSQWQGRETSGATNHEAEAASGRGAGQQGTGCRDLLSPPGGSRESSRRVGEGERALSRRSSRPQHALALISLLPGFGSRAGEASVLFTVEAS